MIHTCNEKEKKKRVSGFFFDSGTGDNILVDNNVSI